MLALLIIAGFIGIFAPLLGFAVLFIGGVFMVSTPAGIAGLVILALVIYYMVKIGSGP